MKKAKKQIKHGEVILTIPIPLYRRTVIIFICSTAQRMIDHGIKHGIDKEKLSPEWRKSVETAVKESAGFCVEYGHENVDVLIPIKKYPTKASEYGCLYHELYHAVDFISKDIDHENTMTDKVGNSEARAYLYEYLATECNKILWNKR